jgi:hypothetical protein
MWHSVKVNVRSVHQARAATSRGVAFQLLERPNLVAERERRARRTAKQKPRLRLAQAGRYCSRSLGRENASVTCALLGPLHQLFHARANLACCMPERIPAYACQRVGSK